MQRLKEPDVPQVDFGLQSTGFEELFTLPEPKPQKLLDTQEDNRKGRLLDSLNKIGGRLEDTSLDFIRRENFNEGDRPVDIARRSIPFTEETFEKIDELLKDPKIKSYSDLGRALGLNIPEPTGVRGKKGPGTPLSKRSGLIKAYEKSLSLIHI